MSAMTPATKTYNTNNFRPRCCKFKSMSVCECGDIWRDHYPYHPHPAQLAMDGKRFTIPVKCSGFREVNVDAVRNELVDIEEGLR